tara:strand:- start:456 stop:908 length:453 start_codon:yes stop_codon:yes gene_type:complete
VKKNVYKVIFLVYNITIKLKIKELKMKQLELFTNNWGVNSGFESLRDKLNELIPASGRCENPMSKNKHLEKFRRAQNAAYDFFNNGLCNKRGLFVSIFAENESYYIDKWNIPTMNSFRYFTRDSWDMWEDQIERILTPIIIAAAKEQGVK